MDALLAPLLNTDGSCEITSGSGGKTRILCGVTGPGDVSGSRRMFDRAALFISINRLPQKIEELTIIVKPSVSQLAFAPCTAHSSNRFINSTVESAIELEAYPRTGIQICTQELKVDGPTESAQLNGICLALLDSGIQMHYIFAAVTMALMETVEAIGEKAGKTEAKDEYIIEPNQLQAKASRAVFTFVFRPSTILAGKLIGAYSSGKFTLEQHQKAAELAERNCLGVFDFYRRKMQEKFIHEIGRDY